MSKPHSFKVEPWTAFPRDTYSILTDDFIHEKLFTVKVSSATLRGTINLKNQIVTKGDNYQSSGQIKIWFPIWKQGTLYFKSVNKEVKVHYDNGITDFNGNKVNFYGSVQTLKQNLNSTFKFGAMYFNPKFDLDNRVRIAFDAANQSDVSTSHKLTLTKDKWSLTAFQIWNWTGAASIARNALRVGYKHDEKTSFFLRAANNNARKFNQFNWGNIDEYFGHFALNLTHQLNSEVQIASEIDFTRRQIGTVSALVWKSLPGKAWIKVRGQKSSTSANLAVAYQGLIKDYGKWLFGLEVAGLGDKNVLRYGAQIDINL